MQQGKVRFLERLGANVRPPAGKPGEGVLHGLFRSRVRGGLRCRGREAATKGPERSGTDPRVCVVLALAEGSVWLIVPFFTVL